MFFSLPHVVQRYSRLVAFEHTVFALPFTLSALLLAQPFRGAWFPKLEVVVWVVLAMVGGRTFAMGLNRLADRHIDARNPRTANRELPQGTVSLCGAWLLTLGALGLLVLATLQLPVLCQQLLPVAFVFLTAYSYTKRFTSLCHVVLGLCLGSAAIAGWLASTGQWNHGLPVLFGLGVLLWVTGFDILYACQDSEFDTAQGLYSIPAKLGLAQAFAVSELCHLGCVGVMEGFAVAYAQSLPLMLQRPAYGFWLALSVMTYLLWKQRQLISPDDLTRMNQAFFTLNGQISVLVLTGCVLDALAHQFGWY